MNCMIGVWDPYWIDGHPSPTIYPHFRQKYQFHKDHYGTVELVMDEIMGKRHIHWKWERKTKTRVWK